MATLFKESITQEQEAEENNARNRDRGARAERETNQGQITVTYNRTHKPDIKTSDFNCSALSGPLQNVIYKTSFGILPV